MLFYFFLVQKNGHQTMKVKELQSSLKCGEAQHQSEKQLGEKMEADQLGDCCSNRGAKWWRLEVKHSKWRLEEAQWLTWEIWKGRIDRARGRIGCGYRRVAQVNTSISDWGNRWQRSSNIHVHYLGWFLCSWDLKNNNTFISFRITSWVMWESF